MDPKSFCEKDQSQTVGASASPSNPGCINVFLLLPKPQRLHTSPEMAAALLALLLASVSLGTGRAMNQGDQGCEDDWTQFGSRCFRFYNERKSWQNAESVCLTAGANLASVHSLQENDFISDSVLNVTGFSAYTWLGGYTDQNHRWVWSDGTPWDFEHWSPGQPDNHNDQEHHLMFNFGERKALVLGEGGGRNGCRGGRGEAGEGGG
uniref:C-type lectin domain-containing protein n=1 Tax=Knipowitschia caucasica TaxID=637954 RepID=A0AAV2L1Z3_KNICA